MAANFSESQRLSVVLFGSEKSIHSVRAKEIKDTIEKWGHKVSTFQSPNEFRTAIDSLKMNCPVVILLCTEKVIPAMTGWKSAISHLRSKPRVAIVSEFPVLESMKQELRAEVMVLGKDSLQPLHDLVMGLADSTKSRVAQLLTSDGGEISLENASQSGSFLGEAVNNAEVAAVTDTQIDTPSELQPGHATSGTLMESAPSAFDNSGGSLDLDADIAQSMSAGIDNLLPNSVGGIQLDDLVLGGNVEAKSSGIKAPDQEPEPLVSVKPHQLDTKEMLADLDLEKSLEESLPTSSVEAPEVDFSDLEPQVYADPNPSDSATVQTIKKYTALKEKEIREKDAINGALTKQIRQIDEKLKKSDQQRRRVSVEHEETLLRIRTLEAQIEQEKNLKTKIEQDHQEQLKDYKLRLENAEFQARRLERKLEDFRERIKNDIQQIRQRERELANRLELQKRDAEALIASKDERLLLQKREIDRLEFEIDSLRDRIVEDTQKSEERAQKLLRALQSLKLAQGVLSGIDDEVLPSSIGKSNKGPASDGEAA